MIDEPTAHRPSSDSRRRNEPRFTPGTMLGDRYRIVALLGSGGMGEVYRADDTKLGQQVALKFLPHNVGRDPARIERLYSEVRLGRQERVWPPPPHVWLERQVQQPRLRVEGSP